MGKSPVVFVSPRCRGVLLPECAAVFSTGRSYPAFIFGLRKAVGNAFAFAVSSRLVDFVVHNSHVGEAAAINVQRDVEMRMRVVDRPAAAVGVVRLPIPCVVIVVITVAGEFFRGESAVALDHHLVESRACCEVVGPGGAPLHLARQAQICLVLLLRGCHRFAFASDLGGPSAYPERAQQRDQRRSQRRGPEKGGAAL